MTIDNILTVDDLVVTIELARVDDETVGRRRRRRRRRRHIELQRERVEDEKRFILFSIYIM